LKFRPANLSHHLPVPDDLSPPSRICRFLSVTTEHIALFIYIPFRSFVLSTYQISNKLLSSRSPPPNIIFLCWLFFDTKCVLRLALLSCFLGHFLNWTLNLYYTSTTNAMVWRVLNTNLSQHELTTWVSDISYKYNYVSYASCLMLYPSSICFSPDNIPSGKCLEIQWYVNDSCVYSHNRNIYTLHQHYVCRHDMQMDMKSDGKPKL